jgi:hypothetical protein
MLCYQAATLTRLHPRTTSRSPPMGRGSTVSSVPRRFAEALAPMCSSDANVGAERPTRWLALGRYWCYRWECGRSMAPLNEPKY